MAVALGALRRIGGSELIDRLGGRDQANRWVFRATRDGMRAAGAATRAFDEARAKVRPTPVRPPASRPAKLFDLTPTDEQQMLQAAFGEFATAKLRPAARKADDACEAPPELLGQAAELGALMLSIPAELGGVVEERSAVTSVLAAEAMAHGDLSLAVACLAPAAVATALSLYGTAEQQATYLPAFLTDDPPAAALAISEPRPLFDPTVLTTTARRDGSDLVLDGEKSLVALATTAELFLIAVELDGTGPALVLVESDVPGLTVAPEPAMGLRAAATGRVHLSEVRVPATALVGDGDPDVYAEVVHRARLGWCAVALGTARAILDHVTPYVNEREAFGEPISHRQSVAFAISDMRIELDGMRLATYRAASLADAGKPFAREAAWAHRLCADKGMAIGSDGVQLLGGHGFVKEHPVERWYRDLRALGSLEGVLLV